jgi:hypothetical protein
MFYNQRGTGPPKTSIWNCGGRSGEEPVAGIDAQTAFHIDAVRFAVGERTLLAPVSLELVGPRQRWN